MHVYKTMFEDLEQIVIMVTNLHLSEGEAPAGHDKVIHINVF